MKNESGLKPLGHAVLVQTYEPERKKSLIELPPSVQERGQMIEQRAVVVAVGEHAWSEEKTPRAKPGDLVLISKFSGYLATGPADGKIYRIINDREIFCQLLQEVVQEVEHV